MNKHSASPSCSWAPLAGNEEFFFVVFFFNLSVFCSEGQQGQRAIYKHKISDSGAKHRSTDPPRHEGYAIKIKEECWCSSAFSLSLQCLYGFHSACLYLPSLSFSILLTIYPSVSLVILLWSLIWKSSINSLRLSASSSAPCFKVLASLILSSLAFSCSTHFPWVSPSQVFVFHVQTRIHL